MGIFFWLFVIIGVPALLILMSKKRGKEIYALAKGGQTVRAVVVDKKKIRGSSTGSGTGSTSYKVSYVYKTENAEEFSKQVNVSMDIFDGLETGSEVGVVYLPSQPDVSAMEYMVDLVKGAMKK